MATVPTGASSRRLINPWSSAVFRQGTAIGLAYSSYANTFVSEYPGLVDYVEIPFEQLVHTPCAIEIRSRVPLVLHCASLSIAGNAPPDEAIVEALHHWIKETATPWLGEHLAYVRAGGSSQKTDEHNALSARVSTREQPFNIGYTVSPQFSVPIMERVLSAMPKWEQLLGVPILLENGPIYFDMPGSTMSQFDFLTKMCAESEAVLLLDLTHLVITCSNLKLNPYHILAGLPLERVVEVHLSGMTRHAEVAWDDHSEPAPTIVFKLLKRLLSEIKPAAITIEYNWDARFPAHILKRDIERVQNMLSI